MLSPLDLLYITLTLFIAVIGTLLILILFKINRIMGVFDEVTGYYYSIKRMFKMYEQIPQVVMEKVKDMMKQTKKTPSASQKKSS